jgi:hypothetical protein
MKKMIILFLLLGIVGCAKPLMDAKVYEDIKYVSQTFPVAKEDAYKAARWALILNKYPLGKRDQEGGVLETSWVPTTTDSHAIIMFNRPDFGVNGGYYKLVVKVVALNGQSRVDVASSLKAVPTGLKSTGTAEKTILRDMWTYLRVKEPEITNVGLDE